MNIELFFAPGACSFVPHAGLELIRQATGQEFSPHIVKLHKGEQRTPEYLAVNPEGLVPALKVDGKPLTQIVAICTWLDREFPQVGLLPTDSWARAQAVSRFAWMNNTAHPTFTHVFMPHKFAETEAAQAEIKRVNVELFRQHLDRIQNWLAHASPWFCGERISFLDFYTLTLLRWGGFAGIDPESLPALWAHVQKVAEHPAAAAAIERERLQLNVYKKD